MTEHYEGDIRIVGNVVQVFTDNAWVNCEYTSDYEKGRADMLNEVIEWLKKELITGDLVSASLKEDMRQQENN